MITLKTIGKATEQEVFDQVVNHLRAQGKQSSNSEGICAYRGEHGLMCAAGCLIANDEYHPNMDYFGQGRDWDSLVADGEVPRDHENLIKRLQNAHDIAASDDVWLTRVEQKLKQIAIDFKLEYEESE